jgi:hypothetical protein
MDSSEGRRGFGDYAIFWAAVLVGILVFGGLGYWLGLEELRPKAVAGWKGNFVTSLSALEKYEAGKETEAIKIIRNRCYSSALVLLEDPRTRNDPIVQRLLPDLGKYFERHKATNRSELTEIEKRLEQILIQKGVAH